MSFHGWMMVLLTLLGFSLLLCLVRLYLGPNPPNRTVAFDTIAVHAVGIMALFTILSDAPALLDGAIIIAVLGFVGTMMFARYMERADLRDWETDNWESGESGNGDGRAAHASSDTISAKEHA